MASFMVDLGVFLDVLGPKNVLKAISFAQHPWESDEQRDAFIEDVLTDD